MQLHPTFSHCLQEATVHLKLMKVGCKLNINGEFDSNGTIEPDKYKVLGKILKNLQAAPVIHISEPIISRFFTIFKEYQSSDAKILNTMKKIFACIAKLSSTVMEWQAGEISNQIDNALCNPVSLKNNAKILYEFCDWHILKRVQWRVICRFIAAIRKIHSLQRLFSNADISFNKEIISIIVHCPTLSDTNQQLTMLKSQLAIEQPQNSVGFIEYVVKEQLSTSSQAYKIYLQDVIYALAIIHISRNWLNHEEDNLYERQSLKIKEFDIALVKSFSNDFLKETEDFMKLKKKCDKINPSIEEQDCKKDSIVLEQQFEYSRSMNEALDRLYSYCYHKLKDCKSQFLPELSPQELSDMKNIFTKNQTSVPIFDKVKILKNELKSIRKIEKLKQEEQAQQKRILKEKPNSNLQLIAEPFLGETNVDLVGIEAPIKGLEKEVGSGKTQVSKPAKKSINPFKYQFNENQFNNNSPFKMDERVLDWFNDSHIQNASRSSIVHNFALVINQIVWERGLHYQHYHEEKQIHEPASTMLCKIKHPFFNESIMTITMTYYKKANSVVCYHRALTQKEQQEQDVRDYVKLTRSKIDFPELPNQSQKLSPSIDKLMNRSYPDGSYIKSVDDQIITVNDPKNKCKIYLFVPS